MFELFRRILRKGPGLAPPRAFAAMAAAPPRPMRRAGAARLAERVPFVFAGERSERWAPRADENVKMLVSPGPPDGRIRSARSHSARARPRARVSERERGREPVAIGGARPAVGRAPPLQSLSRRCRLRSRCSTRSARSTRARPTTPSTGSPSRSASRTDSSTLGGRAASGEVGATKPTRSPFPRFACCSRSVGMAARVRCSSSTARAIRISWPSRRRSSTRFFRLRRSANAAWRLQRSSQRAWADLPPATSTQQ